MVDIVQQTVEIYEDILGAIWDKILPTLGTAAVEEICSSALYRTAEEYPLAELVQAKPTGLDLGELKSRSAELDPVEVRQALTEVIGNIFAIIARLTGNALARRIMDNVPGGPD
jgi:hypothetical protein